MNDVWPFRCLWFVVLRNDNKRGFRWQIELQICAILKKCVRQLVNFSRVLSSDPVGLESGGKVMTLILGQRDKYPCKNRFLDLFVLYRIGSHNTSWVDGMVCTRYTVRNHSNSHSHSHPTQHVLPSPPLSLLDAIQCNSNDAKADSDRFQSYVRNVSVDRQHAVKAKDRQRRKVKRVCLIHFAMIPHRQPSLKGVWWMTTFISV